MDEIKVTLIRRSGEKIFYMQYRDPVTCDKQRKTTGMTNRRDAERMAAAWEMKIKSGHEWGSGKMPWDEFRRRFSEEHLEGLAASSMEKADSVLDCFEAQISPRRLRDVKETTLSDYQTKMRNKGRSPATIKGHLAYLRSSLSWALDNKLIDKMPTFPKISRVKDSKVMKGRPITVEEFERMLAATGAVIRKPNLSKKKAPTEPGELPTKMPPEPDHKRIPSWQHLLTGLWLSGLRISEVMELHWTDRTKIRVDTSLKHPMFRIPAGSEKGNRDRILPMTPDFAQFLSQTPPALRKGFVFNPMSLLAAHGKGETIPPRMHSNAVSKLISEIGQNAKIIVDWKPSKEPTAIYASAHDLRRSFGERWAERVMPKVLMELMRHSSIETTMRYYVGQNAERTAGLLWDQFSDLSLPMHGLGATLGASGQNPTNSTSTELKSNR